MQKFTPGSDAVTGPGRALESLGGGLRSDMKRGARVVLPASSSRSHLSPCTGDNIPAAFVDAGEGLFLWDAHPSALHVLP